MSTHKLLVGVLVSSCALVGALASVVSPALALPEGRAYERVSPLYSGGYGTREILGVAADGESIAFASVGIFAGQANDAAINTYQATRSASSGWSTTGSMPASSVSARAGLPLGFTASLSASLWELGLGERNTGSPSNEVQFAAHPAGSPATLPGFEPVGPLLKSVDSDALASTNDALGFSADLCHAVIEPTVNRPLGQPTEPLIETEPSLPPEVFSSESDNFIYDVSRGCDGESPYARLVQLSDNGTLLRQGDECPLIGNHGQDTFNAISTDGSEIFFEDATGTCASGHNAQLFVRIGGARTLEVSKPLSECSSGEVPCTGGSTRPAARFWGASEDGSRVFFTTTAQLDAGSDGGEGLYMASIGCPGETVGCEASQRVVNGLVQVSRDLHAGQAAEVQGVAGIAADGGRVYFVARGALSEAANAQGGAAVAGADNLYVYDAETGQTAFLADLCSGPGQSGTTADPACPSDLGGAAGRNDSEMWSSGPFPLMPNSPAQVAGEDGRFLVFATYGQLIAGGPEADTDDAQDVYRYDAQSGQLQRVSLGEGGADSNGNSDDSGVESGVNTAGSADARIRPEVAGNVHQEERDGVRRAITEDGSRIVFETVAPLSPDATNGQGDVYEWHDGAVSLISCGCAAEGDSEPVITASGRDVFFLTTAELVPGNSNGLTVLYDARLGGGFPAPQAPVERCEGDACQGALSTPAPLLVPASAVQTPGENAQPTATRVVVKAKRRTKPKTIQRGHRKRLAKKKREGRQAKSSSERSRA